MKVQYYEIDAGMDNSVSNRIDNVCFSSFEEAISTLENAIAYSSYVSPNYRKIINIIDEVVIKTKDSYEHQFLCKKRSGRYVIVSFKISCIVVFFKK